MSEKERIFIFQTEGGGQEESIKIDINKTVNELLDKYLKGKNLTDSDHDFVFMVGANPLKKDKIKNQQIKSLRYMKPNAIIKVREVDTKMGGEF